MSKEIEEDDRVPRRKLNKQEATLLRERYCLSA
jgi:hypothetical protein